MHLIQTPGEMQAWSLEQKSKGQIVGFVPTMGNLHAGHLKLVEEARNRSSLVVVSIFVNPLQFGAGEDFESYPRTLAQDKAKLEALGVDILFTPQANDMYPDGKERSTQVYVPELGDILCGASRDGHFQGVTTVVAKFFNIVQPDIAVFGEKDFQQLFLIRRMVSDLFMPVEILGVETWREQDGLAMSSRNSYLNEEQRRQSAELYAVLTQAREALANSTDSVDAVLSNSMKLLEKKGFEPEYLELRNARTLAPLEQSAHCEDAVLLLAVRLGGTRLIDNLRISLKKRA